MRSSSVVDFVNSCGLRTIKLEGGYKHYRNHVITTLENLRDDFTFAVLHGHQALEDRDVKELEKRGMAIIDLEYYARNSGSVFGGIYYTSEPATQKYFETQIFDYINKSQEAGA